MKRAYWFGGGSVLLVAMVGVVAVAQTPGGSEGSQREVARLKKEVNAIREGTESVGRRLPKLQDEVELLRKKIQSVDPPKFQPPEEKAEERMVEPPAQVGGPDKAQDPSKKEATEEWRLPLSRKSNKKTNLLIICEGGKIFPFNMKSLEDPIKKAIDRIKNDNQKNNQLLTSGKLSMGAFTIEGGSYNIKSLTFFLFVVGEGFEVELIKKPTATGETLEQGKAAQSALQTRLASLKPEDNIIQFYVYPDSYDEFQALRKMMFDRKYEVGWLPLPFGKPILIGSGSASSQ